MSKNYPSISSQSALVQAFGQFRKSLPKSIDSSVLKSLEIAPKNESFIINIFKFLDIIGDDSDVNKDNTGHFYGTTDQYQAGMAKLIKSAYSELFELHGDGAWKLGLEGLTAFFRTKDSASELMGKRKASTFATLAEQAGKREPAAIMSAPVPKKSKKKASKRNKKKREADELDRDPGGPSGYNLAVRVEINLPATSDQSVYQAIFKSLREDLLNG